MTKYLTFTNLAFLYVVCVCVFFFSQDHQYNWDDGIHRDHRPEPRPASSDKSSQAQNYKNQGLFATIKSASLVSLTKALLENIKTFFVCAVRVSGSLNIHGTFTLKFF